MLTSQLYIRRLLFLFVREHRLLGNFRFYVLTNEQLFLSGHFVFVVVAIDVFSCYCSWMIIKFSISDIINLIVGEMSLTVRIPLCSFLFKNPIDN